MPRFEFPLSYIESMLPNTATAHETVTAPMPQDSGVYDSASALKELLSSLESPTIPQPQQPRQYQRVLGALGDALGSMASVRAGGAPMPVGPFAANQMARQKAYEQQRAESEQERIKTRNTVRIGAFQEELLGRRQKDVANIRANVIREHNQAMENQPPKPGYTLGYDENGIAMWFKKPTGDVGTTSEAVPVVAPGGGSVKKTPPANLLGIQQQLDNTSKMLDEMKSNWLQRPKSSIMQGVGTASANILSRGMGANLGLSGLASQIDKHAVIHERDREALATTLAFPLTGSRRSVEGARKSLLDIIPHYTDPPEVWGEFEKQMRYLIDHARRMPWGEQPSTSQEAYGSMIDAMAGAAGSSGGGPYSGKTLRESDFSNAAPGEKERFIAGGGKVEP